MTIKLKIDFEKLNQIPYMKNFSNNSKFQDWVYDYIEHWSKKSSNALDSVALIRAVECTNGCVQYAFRDNEPWALGLEQTRLCMKTSMTFIKTKKLELPNGKIIECDTSIVDDLNNIREIYIDGFKNNIPDKLMQFYANSLAQFYVLGEERLDKQLKFVSDNLESVFGKDFLMRGRNYIFGYLKVIKEIKENV